MKQTKKQIGELAEILYDRTVDFLNEEVIEMLYDEGLIEELDDDAIAISNAVLEAYLNFNLTKNW